MTLSAPWRLLSPPRGFRLPQEALYGTIILYRIIIMNMLFRGYTMEFKIYQNLVEKYYKHDCRELNFQNRILIPFLEQLIPEKYDVVDASTLYKNWKNISRDSFAGRSYTPDILIAQNWDLFEKKQNPLAIIEVKCPTANDRRHANEEVSEYKGKSQRVILTDCITWEIYEKDKKTSFFYLNKLDEQDKERSLVCERSIPENRKDRTIQWINDNIPGNDWDNLNNAIKGWFLCTD